MNIINVGEHSSYQKKGLFLAGPSPRRPSDPNWRPEALRILQNLGWDQDVYIPLTETWGWLDNQKKQIDWELEHLEKAVVIAFWIPRDEIKLPAFTTNVEYGMYVKSGKLSLGFPPHAHHMGYMVYLAEKYGIPTYENLQSTLTGAIALAKRRS